MIPAATLLLFSAGCGERRAPDQLIVKGDKIEITIQEYDQMLRQAPPVAKEAVGPLRRAVLEQLIGEKMFANAAIEAHLDKNPETIQAIAAAQRALLAQAYAAKLTGGMAKPDAAEIRKYYDSHPELFAQRRRFIVEEYILRSDLPKIRAYIDLQGKKGFDALGLALNEDMPGIQPAIVARFTDELPGTNIGALNALTTGSDIVYQSPGQVHLAKIQSVTIEPITVEAVTSRIDQILKTEREAAIISTAVRDLRKSHHVEILNANLNSASAANVREVTNK